MTRLRNGGINDTFNWLVDFTACSPALSLTRPDPPSLNALFHRQSHKKRLSEKSIRLKNIHVLLSLSRSFFYSMYWELKKKTISAVSVLD